MKKICLTIVALFLVLFFVFRVYMLKKSVRQKLPE